MPMAHDEQVHEANGPYGGVFGGGQENLNDFQAGQNDPMMQLLQGMQYHQPGNNDDMHIPLQQPLQGFGNQAGGGGGPNHPIMQQLQQLRQQQQQQQGNGGLAGNQQLGGMFIHLNQAEGEQQQDWRRNLPPPGWQANYKPESEMTEEELKERLMHLAEMGRQRELRKDPTRDGIVRYYTDIKKGWRKWERAEKARLKAIPDTDYAPVDRVTLALSGTKSYVPKRQLPWWVEEMYDIASDSEEEEKMRIEREERLKRPISPIDLSKFKVPPERYGNWRNETKDLSDAYDDFETSSEEELPIDPENDLTTSSDDGLDVDALLVAEDVKEELGVDEIFEEDLPRHMVELLEKNRGPEYNRNVPLDVGDPLALWKSLGFEEKGVGFIMMEHRAEKMERLEVRRRRKEGEVYLRMPKRRDLTPYYEMLEIPDSSESDDAMNGQIGGLGLGTPPRSKKTHRKRRNKGDDVAVNKMGNLNLANKKEVVKQVTVVQEEGKSKTARKGLRDVNFNFDRGYDGDTSDSYSDSDDGAVGGLGLF